MSEENMETKRFPLRVLLTVTTGRLLTKRRDDGDNGIQDLYDILGWMTGESPFTHQLPRFGEECRPWLYRWFPKLGVGEACLASLDNWLARAADDAKDQAILMWLTELKMMFPTELQDEYDVPRIPADDHDRKDP